MNVSILKHPQLGWLLGSFLCFLLSISIGLVLIMILNGGWANHILTPVIQFWSLFQLLWADNALAAIWFLVRKSLFTLAYQDPRSGLNLWTFEFSTLTLLVYIVVALLVGKLLQQLYKINLIKMDMLKLALPGLLGAALILASMSFMTSIEHCSGATWVGFVAMYGLGFDEFQLYPIWQWFVAISGLALFIWGFHLTRTYKTKQPQAVNDK